MKLATLCYLKHAGKTLMLHRIKKHGDVHMGKWNGLGGKFDAGETPEECVVREVEEECGIRISSPELRGVLTFPKFDGIDDWYVFLFVAKTALTEVTESTEGALSWIEDDKLLELSLWEGDRIFLPWVNQGRFFSAKFSYEEGVLRDHSVVFYDRATPLLGSVSAAEASSDRR